MHEEGDAESVTSLHLRSNQLQEFGKGGRLIRVAHHDNSRVHAARQRFGRLDPRGDENQRRRVDFQQFRRALSSRKVGRICQIGGFRVTANTCLVLDWEGWCRRCTVASHADVVVDIRTTWLPP